MIRIFRQYVSRIAFITFFIETLLIVTAYSLAVLLRLDRNTLRDEFGLTHLLLGVSLLITVFQACLYYNRHYESAPATKAARLSRIAEAFGFAGLGLAVVYSIIPSLGIRQGVLLLTLLFAAGAISTLRLAFDSLWHRFVAPEHVLVVGDGSAALNVLSAFYTRRDLAVHITGFVPRPAALAIGFQADEYRPLFGAKSLEHCVEDYGITRLIIASDLSDQAVPVQELVRLRVQGLHMEQASTAIAALYGRVSLESLQPDWFIFSDGFERSRTGAALKRAFDIVCSLLGLFISSPVMAVVAALIWLESRGPVLYRQVRVGRKGNHFTILKYRSMRIDAEAHTGAQWSQENDPRITRLGRFLRRYRLDELPQFVNVLRGDMSFVGPRPERPEFVGSLGEQLPYYHERHTIRPGLTGWAQVRYPYGANVEDAAKKLEYDLFYLQNMSTSFDLSILFRTVQTVFSGHGR